MIRGCLKISKNFGTVPFFTSKFRENPYEFSENTHEKLDILKLPCCFGHDK